LRPRGKRPKVEGERIGALAVWGFAFSFDPTRRVQRIRVEGFGLIQKLIADSS